MTGTFSTLSLSSTQTLPDLVLCPLSSWSAITVVGDDKKSYLQGQVTCDVVALDPTKSTLGAHCDAKGKMLSVFRLFNHNSGYALFQHRSAIEKELQEIKKYAIFSKIEMSQTTDVCIGVLGQQADDFIDTLNNQPQDVRVISGGTAIKIEQNHWLLLVSEEQSKNYLKQDSPTIICDESIWDCADILSGQPRIREQDQLEHIPQAMNLQALDGISFKKGCYTGQETVARAKYRGINKRAMFLLEGVSQEELPEELSIERQVGENWRGAGQILTHYKYSDGKIITLAVLPNNLEAETRFRLTHQPNTELTFGRLPYSLESDE